MAKSRKRRVDSDLSEYILLIIHKDGAQTLEQLKEKTALQTVSFRVRDEKRPPRLDHTLTIETTCNGMVNRKWLQLTSEAKYELTYEGRLQAKEKAESMEQGARMIENQFLSPSATARNSTGIYIFVAVLKMVAGFLSGSVGLIADGADTTVDTAASAIVWAGIKFKKEVLGTVTILGLMFLTAVLLFVNSARSIVENVAGTFTPMTMPLVVIIVELVAMLSMFIVSLYQRFVGKRSQSLSLISQSVDSKNSVYSSAAVIVGALFSIFGVYWIDAIVGAFIAVRITLDGVGLTKEVIRMRRGEKPEFSKYKLPFEKAISQRRLDNFRNWILYAIHNNKLSTKIELVKSLETTFRPSYMPAVFNEFTTGRSVDFEADFPQIIKPLIDEGYVVESECCYKITEKGKTYLKDTIDTIRYRQTEL
jgi:cation diffusion facilitator family transporter